MNVILIKAIQLLCCLSLLVVLHEGGHFGFARLFGIRVDRFYMFFNWKFHLFSTRDKWFAKIFPKIAKKQTEYGIGWIPLGGYCEIAGMVDETTTEEKREAQKNDEHPEELFMNHPIWHRFFVMVGGVLMNLLTALVIYCVLAFSYGEEQLPMREMTQGFQFNETAQQMGFRNGDIPVAFDGVPLENYSFVQQDGVIVRSNYADILRGFSDAKQVTVLRNGKEVVINQPANHPNLMDMQDMTPMYAVPWQPARIDSVLPGSPAAKAGFKKGAQLVSIDGCAIRTWADFDSLMVRRADYFNVAAHQTAKDTLKMRHMTVGFQLADGSKAKVANIVLTEDFLLGVTRSSLFAMKEEPTTTGLYTTHHVNYSVLSCIPAGLSLGWERLSTYVSDLKYMFSRKGAESVGSFITIGSIFPDTWSWAKFWNLTAFISIILAVMNILPIPGLDGGHVMMLLYEKVTGKEPSERFQVILQYIGMGIILALMLLAFGNDIRNFILPLFGF